MPPLDFAPDVRDTCPTCTTLPAVPVGPGVLHLWPPQGHVLGKLRRVLRDAEAIPGGLRLRVAEDLWPVAETLAEALSDREARDVMCLLAAADGTPRLEELAQVMPLERLISRVRGDWLVDMLREQRLGSAFMPIVEAASGRVVGHECLVRGTARDGAPVGAWPIIDTARRADLMFQFDRAARLTHVENAARHGLGGLVFINFSPAAIYDPHYCLRSTRAAIDSLSLPPERIVFEVVESEQVEDAGHLRAILAHYREAGFRVALDDLGAGYASLNMLHTLRPDIVKLDMDMVRGVDADPYKAAIAGKLLEAAHGLGVRTVCEGVETEGELAWLRANGADLVQGYLFGKPTATPSGGTAGPA